MVGRRLLARVISFLGSRVPGVFWVPPNSNQVFPDWWFGAGDFLFGGTGSCGLSSTELRAPGSGFQAAGRFRRFSGRRSLLAFLLHAQARERAGQREAREEDVQADEGQGQSGSEKVVGRGQGGRETMWVCVK